MFGESILLRGKHSEVVNLIGSQLVEHLVLLVVLSSILASVYDSDVVVSLLGFDVQPVQLSLKTELDKSQQLISPAADTFLEVPPAYGNAYIFFFSSGLF